MQSAARVPIMISFEVEDYEGPNQNNVIYETDELQTYFGQSAINFSHDQLREIQQSLGKFTQVWMPVVKQSDCIYERNFLEQIFDEGVEDRKEAKSQVKCLMHAMLGRQTMTPKSMFQGGSLRNEDAPSRDKLLDKQDEQNFIKLIKEGVSATIKSKTELKR